MRLRLVSLAHGGFLPSTSQVEYDTGFLEGKMECRQGAHEHPAQHEVTIAALSCWIETEGGMSTDPPSACAVVSR